QQRDQDRDDGDDHQEFDQGETATIRVHRKILQNECCRDGVACWRGGPHPAFGHPLPRGEGDHFFKSKLKTLGRSFVTSAFSVVATLYLEGISSGGGLP